MNLENSKTGRFLAAACLVFLLLALTACGSSGGDTAPEPPAPPPIAYTYTPPADIGDGWSVTPAADLNVAVTTLEDMMNALDSDFDIVDSIAVAYRGELILNEVVRTELNQFDAWVDNVDPAMHVMFSASKSLLSLAVGIAIEQGVFTGLDQPYLDLFPYPDYANPDPRKSDILLEDVLTMRLGLEWNEWDPPYSSPDNQMLRFYETETDFSKSLLDLPMAFDPGTRFAYSTPASASLGQAIENNAPLSLIDFGGLHALSPLGISNVEVFRTPTGLPDLGRGLFLTARDLLKFGQLYADGGIWNGEQLVSADWIAASTFPHTEFGWLEPDNFSWKLTGYGYQWWTGYFEVGGAQVEAYAARGHGQQVLMVMPELELVVAVFSHAFGEQEDEVNQIFDLIDRFLIPALPS